MLPDAIWRASTRVSARQRASISPTRRQPSQWERGL